MKKKKPNPPASREYLHSLNNFFADIEVEHSRNSLIRSNHMKIDQIKYEQKFTRQ